MCVRSEEDETFFSARRKGKLSCGSKERKVYIEKSVDLIMTIDCGDDDDGDGDGKFSQTCK